MPKATNYTVALPQSEKTIPSFLQQYRLRRFSGLVYLRDSLFSLRESIFRLRESVFWLRESIFRFRESVF